MRTYNYRVIRQRRLEIGISQTYLAKIAGIAREHLIELENGRKIPRATTLAKLAYALNVTESYFFTNSDGS